MGDGMIKELGSPAHAGIDLKAPRFHAVWSRFPRTRGDRPADWLAIYDADKVPPHTRG